MFETTNQIILAYIHYIDINVWVKKKWDFQWDTLVIKYGDAIGKSRTKSGWLYTYPLKNMSSSLGMMIPN
jgi:hypothetical protein